LTITVGTNNQITTSGFTYDGVGNELTDVTNAYAWDAESQIKTANSINYLYDGEGNRVQKSNGKIYWYGAGSEILDESDLSGNITNEYVFFGGKRIAYKAISSGRTFYYAEDMLGTSRVMTTSTGTVCYDADFYPFGGEDTFNNGCPQNYKFTGKERDAETDNDDFGARYYSSTYGRWLSADWSAVPAPVPYANLTNPQTLNLYAMVGDSPETFADLDGHVGGLGGPEVLPSNELDDPADEGGSAFTPPQKHLGGSGFEDLDNAAANYYATEQDRQAQNQSQTQTQQNQQQQNTAPANSRTDVVLYGREYTPTPTRETAWFWEMDWKAGSCSGDKCSQSSANQNQTISLSESQNGGPFKPTGDPSKGEAHDQISPEPKTFNQHWSVDGKQVQLVVGKDSNGNLVKTWEVHVVINKLGDRPVYSPVP
jgi:RHS repeat-associated protein